ncbi:uncharacterized protein LOC143027653 [Oratosquilla oratoria]|uniref:uncharacterized protein LOC143027653 n=1 Tax=Oratosquilla oratoria TaxID=337810 RepID=UPI003F760039
MIFSIETPPQIPACRMLPNISICVKRPAARRALTELGPNDAKRNIIMAESLITISQEQFRKKWNFDPVTEKPLPPGRYLWSPVPQQRSSRPQPQTLHSTNRQQTLNDRLPVPTDPTATENCCNPAGCLCASSTADKHSTLLYHGITALTALDNRRHSKTTASTDMHCSVTTEAETQHSATVYGSNTPTSPRTKQCKITEYGRQRKRIHSQCKSDDSEPEMINSPRKRPATETLGL